MGIVRCVYLSTVCIMTVVLSFLSLLALLRDGLDNNGYTMPFERMVESC
jgi:hypothetical protein